MQEIRNLAAALGVDVQKLSDMMNCAVTEANINEFGRFSDLVSTVDKAKAKAYFEWLEEKPLSILKVNSKASKLLRSFILAGGFVIDLPTEE